MKTLINHRFRLKNKHNSSNQLKFGKHGAYRPKEYSRNMSEMTKLFMELDFNIPEKVPLGVKINYYYPRPKSGTDLPITRHTKDLDSTKGVNDALMTAGKQLMKKHNPGVDKVSAMYDDSQIVTEILNKYYWDEESYGLDLIMVAIEPGDGVQLELSNMEVEE